MQKVAIITGVTGQDGSYLAELLLDKGYKVHGIVRRSSSFNRGRIEHLYPSHENVGSLFQLHYGDVSDIASLIKIIKEVKPNEIYNLAAQSHVQVSYDTPIYTGQVDALGVLNVIEAVRILNPSIKIYQASTSELYSGDPEQTPQNENTAMFPKSPYGVAKLYAYNMVRVYREAYGMFISNGILFNHESPRRGENFVTRKITIAIAEILKGKRDVITLGNLDAKRDWGHARDYVEGMWRILQHDKPDDFVISTGETHSVREFVQEAFRVANERYGSNLSIEKHVKISDRLIRPNEVKELHGDSTKLKEELGWSPSISFKELVFEMVHYDYEHPS
jgi:GDPmannose 4,6-dehydratase|tara:strand:- start:9840 stop:10841 length:1002 start_codon:yes stop_codon:yes gene_type:complete